MSSSLVLVAIGIAVAALVVGGAAFWRWSRRRRSLPERRPPTPIRFDDP